MSGPDDSLRDEVFEALENAVENGHEPQVLNAEALTTDLKDKCQPMEAVPFQAVKTHVTAWLARHGL